MTTSDTEDLLRALSPQVLGAVVRRYGHFTDAEDAVQEALAAAAAAWPGDGIPDDPRAWLIKVASRRMTDIYRAEEARRRRQDLAASWSTHEGPAISGHDDSVLLLFMVEGPQAGLVALGTVEEALSGNHRLDAVRGHLLEMAGQPVAAAAALRAAAARATNARERDYLVTKAAQLTRGR